MTGLVAAGSLLIVSLICVGSSHAQSSGTKNTVTGYLRDSYCYVVSGAQGSVHKPCATACAEKGIPVLLVESAPTASYQVEGSGKSLKLRPSKSHRTFVLLPSTDLEPLPQDVIDKMEEEVTITGEVFEREGMSFLRVDTVQ